MDKISKYLKIILVTILLLISLILPSSAETIEKAGVFLDGREIIQVSAIGSISATERSDRIKTIFKEIANSEAVRTQEKIEVRIGEVNGLPVIYVNDRYLVTITQNDLIDGNTEGEQAEIWQEQIQSALRQAARERSSKFLQQALIESGGLFLIALVFHFILGRFWSNSLGKTANEKEELFLGVRLLLARLALWLALIVYLANTYPQSRRWLYFLTNDSIAELIFPLLFILFALIFGQYTPTILKFSIERSTGDRGKNINQNLIAPVSNLLRMSSTLILISYSLIWIEKYPVIYEFCNFFLDLATILSVAWLSSRLFRQFVRVYGIELIRKLGREVDELLLVFETLANTIIGFIAVLAFAQSRFDLIGLFAGLGVGGLAIVFAAQQTLQQLLGTVVLYLDRPFIPGEYIRLPSGLFGRVESIGLRSTKIRTAAKGTLIIFPNSTMANLEIENITRGKKVMVLLYLDFLEPLKEQERALVQQTIKKSTDTLFGIDPGSTKISLFQPEDRPGTRARVTFFILGSSENSLQLRKRLLEIANEKISQELSDRSITFTMQEPTIYVESPVTI